jgi:UDP-2,3-diacylglucosamine pyrophosphatase LpxH
MSQDEKRIKEKLSSLWDDSSIPELDTVGKKYIIFSDLHLGDGGGADDFHKNEKTLETALEYYFDKGFNLILLGDIEELWQFDLEEIVKEYKDTVYKKIKTFGNERVFRVFGNHDREWGPLYDPIRNPPIIRGSAYEAFKMKNNDGNPRILLTHGHQGSKDSDIASWSSRFFVRLFKFIEPCFKKIGFTHHPEATKSRIVKNYEQIFYSWAKAKKVISICGHSHRAIFASHSRAQELKEKIHKLKEANNSNSSKIELKKLREELKSEKRKKRDIDPVEPDEVPKPCYFNTGCGLYKDGITGIEIEDDEIRLVKWDRKVLKKLPPFGTGKISEYISRL